MVCVLAVCELQSSQRVSHQPDARAREAVIRSLLVLRAMAIHPENRGLSKSLKANRRTNAR
jgi:hypothetical protein